MFPLLRAGVLLYLTSSLALPASAAESVDARLDRLERELAEVRQENAVLRARMGEGAAGANAPAAPIRPLGRETKLQLGGYLQLNAEFGDAPDARFDARDRFLVRRARWGIRGNWSEPVSFKLEADFGNNSIAGKSGYSAQLTDAFADYAVNPALVLRVGQFKTPFGQEQLQADTRLLTVERSLPNDRLTLGRQVGLGASGEWADERIGYSVGLFNGNGANVGFNDDDRFLLVGRLATQALRFGEGRSELTVAIGVNGYTTRSDDGQRRGAGVDLQADAGPFTLNFEMLEAIVSPLLGPDTRRRGWSILAASALPLPRWQAVARLEGYDADTRSPDAESRNLTVGFVYRLLHDDLRLTFNYVLGDPAGPRDEQGRLLTSAQLIF